MTIDDLAKGNWPDLDTIVMSNFVDSQEKIIFGIAAA